MTFAIPPPAGCDDSVIMMRRAHIGAITRSILTTRHMALGAMQLLPLLANQPPVFSWVGHYGCPNKDLFVATPALTRSTTINISAAGEEDAKVICIKQLLGGTSLAAATVNNQRYLLISIEHALYLPPPSPSYNCPCDRGRNINQCDCCAPPIGGGGGFFLLRLPFLNHNIITSLSHQQHLHCI